MKRKKISNIYMNRYVLFPIGLDQLQCNWTRKRVLFLHVTFENTNYTLLVCCEKIQMHIFYCSQFSSEDIVDEHMAEIY